MGAGGELRALYLIPRGALMIWMDVEYVLMMAIQNNIPRVAPKPGSVNT